MSQAREKHAKDGLVVLGFNSDSSVKKMNDYITEKGYDWSQWFLGKDLEALQEKYWVAGYPTTFLVGRDGKILSRSIRLGLGSSQQLIEAALKQPARSEASDADGAGQRKRD